MGHPESTTDPSEHRCPECSTALLFVETNLQTFRCCEHCGWYAPPGFEKVRVRIRWDETDQLPVRRAYSYVEQPQRAVQRPLQKIQCTISEMIERVTNFQQKLLNNRPSSQLQQNPEAAAAPTSPAEATKQPEEPKPEKARKSQRKSRPTMNPDDPEQAAFAKRVAMKLADPETYKTLSRVEAGIALGRSVTQVKRYIKSRRLKTAATKSLVLTRSVLKFLHSESTE